MIAQRVKVKAEPAETAAGETASILQTEPVI
jgi:hypothetical protein